MKLFDAIRFEGAVAFFALIAVTAVLVLPNLGKNCLWEDEAQTALIARNILSQGIPAASDGKNFVSIFSDHRDVRDGIYIWQGWLPSYLAAASMSIFGRNAFAARLPFAIAFVALVGVYYFFLTRRGDRNPHLAITIALTVVSVPLFLHARQCRYYLLVPLFNLLIIDSYLNLLKRRKFLDQLLLIAWATLLLNTFFPGALLLGFALLIDSIKRRPTKASLKSLGISMLAILILNLPMAWFCRIWDRRFGGESGQADLPAAAMYLLRYFLTLNNYFFPLILVFVGCAMRWTFFAKKLLQDEVAFLFLTICVTQLVGFSFFSDYPFTRYVIGIAPFVFYLGAICIEGLAFNRQWLVWSLTVLVAMTNLLNNLVLWPLRHTRLQNASWTTAGIDLHFIDPLNVRVSYARGEIKALINSQTQFPLIDYLRSIVRPPKGPIDVIVDYLEHNAPPEDRVKITYGDLPLMFHTQLAITSSAETGEPGPQWIVSRHFRPLRTDDKFFQENSKYRYLPIMIPFPDLQWNDQPDPLYHYYHTPSDKLAPAITILKKL